MIESTINERADACFERIENAVKDVELSSLQICSFMRAHANRLRKEISDVMDVPHPITGRANIHLAGAMINTFDGDSEQLEYIARVSASIDQIFSSSPLRARASYNKTRTEMMGEENR